MQPSPDVPQRDSGDVISLTLASVRAADAFGSSQVDPPPRLDSADLALLRRTVEFASTHANAEEAAQAVLDVITDGLGLSSGTIALLRRSAEGLDQLVPTAASGRQAALLRDMPPIDVDSSYEAAVVFTNRQPHYVTDVHGEGLDEAIGEKADNGESVGRWRSLIATRSYAVLPLGAGSETVGSMTLQWPDTRDFSESTKEFLETIAAVAGAVLKALLMAQLAEEQESAAPSAGPATQTPETLARVAAPLGPLRFEVTADGVLLPLSPDAEASEDARLVVEVTLADADSVVWDVSTPHPGVVSILLAYFEDASVAQSLRDRLVQTKRVCGRQDISVPQTLSLLDEIVAASSGPGIAAPAWLGVIDTEGGAVTQSGSPESEAVVQSRDGREWTPALECPRLGTSGVGRCAEDVRLLLPGDRAMVRLGDAEVRIIRP